MAKQFRIQRTLVQIPISAGGFATYDLPRGYDYESIHLRVIGSVQVTTAATSVRAEAPTQILPRVELIADGRNTIYSAPFWFATLAKYDRRATESGARMTTPPTAAAIATYPIEALGVIDLCTPDGERPKDSNFRTDGLQLWQIRLSFGNAIDMFVPGAGVAVFVNCVVEVSTTELVELPDAATNVRSTPAALKKVSFQEIALQTSNANQEIRLPAGNMIKSVVLRTDGLATAGEPSVGVLNNINVQSGVDVRMQVRGAALRGKNNNDFGQIQLGYYIADFTRNGGTTARLTELWDVTNQAEPKLFLDVVGGANVKAQAVVTEYLALK